MKWTFLKLAEGVGFEPTNGLPRLLISSQVPLTTQPPFRLLYPCYHQRFAEQAKLRR
jgi:hypothetical protein